MSAFDVVKGAAKVVGTDAGEFSATERLVREVMADFHIPTGAPKASELTTLAEGSRLGPASGYMAAAHSTADRLAREPGITMFQNLEPLNRKGMADMHADFEARLAAFRELSGQFTMLPHGAPPTSHELAALVRNPMGGDGRSLMSTFQFDPLLERAPGGHGTKSLAAELTEAMRRPSGTEMMRNAHARANDALRQPGIGMFRHDIDEV